ncbi:MAG: transcriptional repressor [Elusimicrobiales bacterium]|nr:transcriptional repressor [Elusimicrobiales bacterium]
MKKTPGKDPAFRLTPQRAGILRFLDGNKSHPSAEDIYARLRRKFPGMSFATVYNTLQSLLALGGLTEVKIDGARARFDPDTKPHSHLMCVSCGAIADLPAPRGLRPAGAPSGFKVLRCNVEFYGVCRACAPAAKKEKTSCQKKKRK